MIISEARREQLEALMVFYEEMCRVLDEKAFLPNGNLGGFPSRAMVETAIKDRTQFVGTEDGRIIAAYIMNHECDEAYSQVKWNSAAAPEETVILHALRVHPQFGGQGRSKRLVEHAIATARQWKQKAIRLDCIVGNDIPMRMYESFGFRRVDTVEICYEDIGVPMRFVLFELVL